MVSRSKEPRTLSLKIRPLSLLIQPVDEEAQKAKVDAVEGEAEARQVGDFRFVGFLGQGVALEYFAGRVKDTEEFVAQMFQLFLAELALKADDQVGANEAVGVK